MGRLKSRRLGHGTNPLAVLAHQRLDSVRCETHWGPRPRDLDPHDHKCKRLPGHLSEHKCACGASYGSRGRTGLGR